jgi:hypothetical protein
MVAWGRRHKNKHSTIIPKPILIASQIRQFVYHNDLQYKMLIFKDMEYSAKVNKIV